jgi:adenosine deaminase CECR1
MIDIEKQLRTGGDMKLNDKESRVNETLMQLKMKEMELARLNITSFPPAVHFFRAKRLIDDSQVFKILRRMPKGAVLHVHDASICDVHWLIKNATYDPRCYMCNDHATSSVRFHFFASPPTEMDCDWRPVTEVRSQTSDPLAFDEMLYRNLTLVVDDPERSYPNADAVWSRFLSLFKATFGLVLHAPTFRAFFYEALQQFYDDNVQYMELRSLFNPVYELDGTLHDKEWVLEAYINTTKQFVRDHPDFTGAKFIYTTSRMVNKTTVGIDVKNAIKLRQKFPGYLAGYDLVSNEEAGHSLVYYIDELLYPSQNNANLPYFFHAGETEWKDQAVDLNVIDAIMLNTSRIGHGFAIVKHPVAEKLAQQNDIPLEICPISNQVLMLVKDLRNHPAAVLMATGFPMVISSDDPSLWGAVGLSYDFYEAFMGLGGQWADLATLKQLAIDSLRYSSLSPSEKKIALDLWQTKWDTFIDQTVEDFSIS